MQHDTISLKRRQLMMAGLAGVSVPASVFAGPWGGTWGGAPRNAPAVTDLYADDSGLEGRLVVSGRIVGPDGKPRAGAIIDAWRTDADRDRGTLIPGRQEDLPLRASTTTDADGRFFFTLTTPAETTGHPQHIHCRVSQPGQETLTTQIYFAGARNVPADQAAQLQRDDTGVWRATFGLTLA